MAIGKTVAVLAISAAVCMVFFAQEATSQSGGVVNNECSSRLDCVQKAPGCPNPCCHGYGQGYAGKPTNETEIVNAFAIRQGECECCLSPKSCVLMEAEAQNDETLAGAGAESCKVYSGDSAQP